MAPGSVALETIYQRLAAAEEELKRLQELQETCREAVERLVRTSSPTGSAASTASVPLGQVEEEALLMATEEDVSVAVDVTLVAVDDGEVAGSQLEQIQKITTTTQTVQSIETATPKNGKAKKSSPPR